MHLVFYISIIFMLPNFSAILKITLMSQYWLLWSALFVYLLVFTALIMSYKAGLDYVKYFLVLWLVVIGGIMIRTLTLMNLLPYNSFTYNSGAYQFPLALVLILKSFYDKYNSLITQNKALEFKYNELINRLETRKQVHRIAGLDVELIKKKIKAIVKTETSFYEIEFDLQQMADSLKILRINCRRFLIRNLKFLFLDF